MVTLPLNWVVPDEAVKVPAWRVKVPSMTAGVTPAPKLIVVKLLFKVIAGSWAPSGMVKLWSPAPSMSRTLVPEYQPSKVEATEMGPLALRVPLVLQLKYPLVKVVVPSTCIVSPVAIYRPLLLFNVKLLTVREILTSHNG